MTTGIGGGLRWALQTLDLQHADADGLGAVRGRHGLSRGVTLGSRFGLHLFPSANHRAEVRRTLGAVERGTAFASHLDVDNGPAALFDLVGSGLADEGRFADAAVGSLAGDGPDRSTRTDRAAGCGGAVGIGRLGILRERRGSEGGKAQHQCECGHETAERKLGHFFFTPFDPAENYAGMLSGTIAGTSP